MTIKICIFLYPLIVSLFVCVSTTNTTNASSKVIRGCIRIDGSDEALPQFRILFDGHHAMSDREGFFSLPCDDEETAQTLSLLLTSNVTQHFDKYNTLKYLAAHPKKHSFFMPKLNYATGRSHYQKAPLLGQHHIIPKHCVVVIINPTLHVDRIEPWSVDFGTETVKLPVIVLKKEHSAENINAISSKTLLKTLDTTTFHNPIKTERTHQSNPNVCITMTR